MSRACPFILSFVSITFAFRPVDGLAATIPIWFDSSNHLHRDLKYHPEQPERITACVKALSRESCVHLMDVAENPTLLLPSPQDGSFVVDHAPFTEEELQRARQVLLQTHAPNLVTDLEKSCYWARERRIKEGKDSLGHMGYVDSGETFITTETFGVLLRATAAWIRAVDQAVYQPQTPTFALTRPPGHHATRDDANGFCLVNFAAAAALHALESCGNSQRVSILDTDVHYGQGVADIVAGNPRIRYVSMHQVPAFPFVGQSKKIEHGNVLTLPMPPDTTWTCGYKDLLEEALDFVYNDEWQPDLVIVCAGYDALGSDELASCSLTAADFGLIARRLRQHLPSDTAVMMGLEGGYQLKDAGAAGNLPQAVVETVRALAE